jgi:hypothetical protein
MALTTLREKLIKIGATAVEHARYVVVQVAEVAGSHGCRDLSRPHQEREKPSSTQNTRKRQRQG